MSFSIYVCICRGLVRSMLCKGMKNETDDLTKHSLQEYLHDDRWVREDGSNDLAFLIDGHSNLIV